MVWRYNGVVSSAVDRNCICSAQAPLSQNKSAISRKKAKEQVTRIRDNADEVIIAKRRKQNNDSGRIESIVFKEKKS